MRRSFFLLVLIALLLLGGFLTVQVIVNGPGGALPGLRVQTLNPEASALAITTNQALIFVLFAGFTLGSLIAGGALLAFVLRYLDRQVQKAKQQE